jgi:RNA polymerase sigma factor (sigma-70 family)
LDIDSELRQRIQFAINALTPRQKEIIYLRYFNDLSYDQICELMNINYQSARTQHYNALKVLRSELKNSTLALISVLGLHFL